MKRLLCLFVLLSLIITGCSQYEGTAKKLIYDYYKKNRLVTSNDAVNIIKAKPIGEQYLILSEYTGSDGKRCLDLLMVKKDKEEYSVSREAIGILPSDMDLSVNKLTYDNSTILFGTFNSKKIKNDEKDKSCSKMVVKLTGGDSIEENINGENGYIITIKSTSEIKDITLLSQDGSILLSKTGLDENSPLINKTKFLLTR